MIDIMKTVSPEEAAYFNYQQTNSIRGTLIEVHISDIHFGKIDPKVQYEILKEQFLDVISKVHFDILAIDGDLYDHKFMNNNPAVLYATMFISNCVSICASKNATLMMIAGTELHDSNQYKPFYHYMYNPSIDVRIIEEVRFEYVKGAKILCIPELYNKGSEYYKQFLFRDGYYDSVFMHGTIKGAVYQEKFKGLDSDREPTFTMEDFAMCKGPILSGHVHTGGNFYGYFYYCGSPIRWQFGEENEKGFLIVAHNLDTCSHYAQLVPINSFIYKTIDANDLIEKPQELIQYLSQLKSQEVDNIRLDFSKLLSNQEEQNLSLVKDFFRSDNSIRFKYDRRREQANENYKEKVEQSYTQYAFLLDKALDPYTKFCMYVNSKEGREFIKVDELKELLTDN